MVRELDSARVDAFLLAQLFARVAYVDLNGRPSIAPIAYAFDGESFYGYSLLGGKIEAMSAHPLVCVAVDRTIDAADWWSVVAYGTFEILSGGAAADAVRRVSERMRIVAHVTDAPADAAQTYVEREGGSGFAYRIRVLEKHGRYSAATA